MVQARAAETLSLRTKLTAAIHAANEVDMLDDRKPDLLMKVSDLQVLLGRAYGNLSKELVYLIAEKRRTHAGSPEERSAEVGKS